MSVMIDKIISKIKQANRSKSKEILLTIDEANDLMFELTKVLDNQNTIMKQMLEIQTQKNDITVEFDGGKF